MIVLRVFTNMSGKHGNPVGIIEDIQNKLANNTKQAIAAKSGFSEIVFITSHDPLTLRIYNPQQELEFAGHAVVGAGYYAFKKNLTTTKKIILKHDSVNYYQEDGLTWIHTTNAHLPPWHLVELDSAKYIDLLNLDTYSQHTLVWSWIDKARGLIRARTFAPDWGIPEDEANGSGAILLTQSLGIPLTVLHGQGSQIYTTIKQGVIHLGGRVVIEKSHQ